jgi:hypothetical protein
MGIDFAQNMDVSHFQEEKPADILDFSPWTLNVLSYTDLTSWLTQMRSYGYTEAEGNKGSNSIAFLIMKGLVDISWLIQGQTEKQLPIAMDNYSDQT